MWKFVENTGITKNRFTLRVQIIMGTGSHKNFQLYILVYKVRFMQIAKPTLPLTMLYEMDLSTDLG